MPDRVFIRKTPRGEVDGRKFPRMRPLLLTSGGALVFALMITASLVPAEDATRVITDTPDYCNQLYSQASAEERAAREPLAGKIHNLVERGEEMCHAGQIRGGIIRLRRALTMMHPPPATEQK